MPAHVPVVVPSVTTSEQPSIYLTMRTYIFAKKTAAYANFIQKCFSHKTWERGKVVFDDQFEDSPPFDGQQEDRKKKAIV